MDVLFPDAIGAKKFGDLPSKAGAFVEEVERTIGIPVTLIGTGPSSEDLIDRTLGGC
jgi:adenylosuccinate synthase